MRPSSAISADDDWNLTNQYQSAPIADDGRMEPTTTTGLSV